MNYRDNAKRRHQVLPAATFTFVICCFAFGFILLIIGRITNDSQSSNTQESSIESSEERFSVDHAVGIDNLKDITTGSDLPLSALETALRVLTHDCYLAGDLECLERIKSYYQDLITEASLVDDLLSDLSSVELNLD